MLTTYDIDRLDNRDPDLIARSIERLTPFMEAWFRPVVRGIERIPDGAALYVGNHNGGLLSADTFVWAAAAYRAHGIDAVPYGLGHEVGIQIPGLHQVLVPLGAVRASHDNGRRLFAEGRKVLVYPGGDLDSMRSFRDRHRIIFGPRRGYVRLAVRGGVPIVPVVAVGAHSTFVVFDDGRWLARALGLRRLFRLEVWPITFSLPWGFFVGVGPPYFPLPTRIFVEIMEPIQFDREGEEAASDAEYVEQCHTHVLSSMQATMDRLVAERRRARWSGLLS